MMCWTLMLGLALAADTAEPEISFEPQLDVPSAPAEAPEPEPSDVPEQDSEAAGEVPEAEDGEPIGEDAPAEAPDEEPPTELATEEPPAEPTGEEAPAEVAKDTASAEPSASEQPPEDGHDAPHDDDISHDDAGHDADPTAPEQDADAELAFDTALPVLGEPIIEDGDVSDTRETVQAWVRTLMPGLPTRGPSSALRLAFATLVCLAGSRGLRRVQGQLAPTGLLPEAAGITAAGLRVLASLLALGALVALVPRPLAPMIPVALLAAAAAIGWSFQELVQDVAAGVLLAVEQRIRQGHFVNLGGGLEGVVEQLGLRATWIRTPDGRQLGVPNREMVNRPVYTDPTPWPATEAVVRVPPGISSADARATLQELARLSPWVAPDAQVEVWQDPSGPDAFRVRARLIDEEYISNFRGALQDELLATLSRKG